MLDAADSLMETRQPVQGFGIDDKVNGRQVVNKNQEREMGSWLHVRNRNHVRASPRVS